MDVLIYLTVERGPVSNAAIQRANMNEIEACLFKGPFLCTIIDLELAVWGNPSRLYRRQVGSNDLGRWEHICHIPAGSLSQNVLRNRAK